MGERRRGCVTEEESRRCKLSEFKLNSPVNPAGDLKMG